ncbi:MAG: hypothetical protein HC919_10425 [Oscillatoriales cyanobacterium SM2_2_1]|nr:hypothetical protein [Oscillatoriales cyanobacterium SM2_2_1]
MICCKKNLAKAIRFHRNFHLTTGLIADKGARLVGAHRCPLTKPFYKLAKVAGYSNFALASIALVLLED